MQGTDLKQGLAVIASATDAITAALAIQAEINAVACPF